MKRVALLTVFFCVCTFTFTSQSQAAVISKLSRIPVGQVGDKVKTVVSSNDVMLPTTMALRSDSTYEAAANLLTIPIYAYNPALGIAASAVIGFAFDSKLDVKEAYDKKLLQGQAALNEIINGNLPTSSTPVTDSVVNVPTGSIWSINGQNKLVGSGSWKGGTVYNGSAASNVGTMITGNVATYQTSGGLTAYMGLGYVSGVLHLVRVAPMSGTSTDMTQRFYWSGSLTDTTEPVSYPTNSPETLTNDQAASLAQAIANAIATNPAVKNALDSVIKSNPDIITNAPQISQQDVDNFITTNNYTSNQSYIDYLTNLSNEYPTDNSIKIALEQAKAEQVKEEAETYAPITDSPFDSPYNPGEFDIPARFTQFLNNVKSSGLFSFSNDFFNSLPGGGSPIFEIEGGIFGSHRIDLSETMSGGLAVLKTVLLALFGFLSIRAVIMKR